jgi:hypothetical protein
MAIKKQNAKIKCIYMCQMGIYTWIQGDNQRTKLYISGKFLPKPS